MLHHDTARTTPPRYPEKRSALHRHLQCTPIAIAVHCIGKCTALHFHTRRSSPTIASAQHALPTVPHLQGKSIPRSPSAGLNSPPEAVEGSKMVHLLHFFTFHTCPFTFMLYICKRLRHHKATVDTRFARPGGDHSHESSFHADTPEAHRPRRAGMGRKTRHIRAFTCALCS